jgi:hypothetical protein
VLSEGTGVRSRSYEKPQWECTSIVVDSHGFMDDNHEFMVAI